MWRKFKAGQETDTIPDGIATTLIRVGAAALVEEKNDVTTTVIAQNKVEPPDGGNGSDHGTDNTGRSEKTALPLGVGHKSGRRANQPNSGRS